MFFLSVGSPVAASGALLDAQPASIQSTRVTMILFTGFGPGATCFSRINGESRIVEQASSLARWHGSASRRGRRLYEKIVYRSILSIRQVEVLPNLANLWKTPVSDESDISRADQSRHRLHCRASP